MKYFQKTPSNILICRERDFSQWLNCPIYNATWNKLSLDEFVKDATMFLLALDSQQPSQGRTLIYNLNRHNPAYYHHYWDDLADEDVKIVRLIDGLLIRPYYGKFITSISFDSKYKRCICLHNYYMRFRLKLDHSNDSILIRPSNQMKGSFAYEPLGHGQRNFLKIN